MKLPPAGVGVSRATLRERNPAPKTHQFNTFISRQESGVFRCGIMQFALVSDLHGQKSALDYFGQIVENYKVAAVVICGDITQYDDISYLKKIFLCLKNSKTNAFMVWGNSDGPQAQQAILGSKYNIHLAPKQIGNYKIVGIGETDQPAMIKSEDIKGSILVTHKPPLRKLLIKQYSGAPKFHISGHLHTTKSVKKYPSTTAIQVPTLQNGEFALFDPSREEVHPVRDGRETATVSNGVKYLKIQQV